MERKKEECLKKEEVASATEKMPFNQVWKTLPWQFILLILVTLLVGFILVIAAFVWVPNGDMGPAQFTPAVAVFALAVALFGHFMQQGTAHYFAAEKRRQECVEKIAEAVAASALRRDAFERLVETGIRPAICAGSSERGRVADRIDVYKKNWHDSSMGPAYWGRIYMSDDQKEEFRRIGSTAMEVRAKMAGMAAGFREGVVSELDLECLESMAKEHFDETDKFADRHLGGAIV